MYMDIRYKLGTLEAHPALRRKGNIQRKQGDSMSKKYAKQSFNCELNGYANDSFHLLYRRLRLVSSSHAQASLNNLFRHEHADFFSATYGLACIC